MKLKSLILYKSQRKSLVSVTITPQKAPPASSPLKDSTTGILLSELEEAIILTKVHSMENEAAVKIDLLRSLNIKNDIIIVPYKYKKTDIVIAKNSILVDDTVHNLDDWSNAGGIPIFFNKDNEDIDSWKKENTKYQKIKTLKELSKFK